MADIRSLDLTLLRAFDALLREGSVSRAAARLHLSQPATSALLARLREVFADALFVRHARGITPTARAQELAEPVRRLLAGLQALLEPPERFDPATATRAFHLATTDSFGLTTLAPLLCRLRKLAPGLRLALVSAQLDNLAPRLAAGEVDAAVLARGRAPRGLRTQLLYEEDFVLALPADHPLARRRRALQPADLCALPHVYVSPVQTSFTGLADQALQALGLQRQVSLSVNHFAAAVEAVARGGLAAVLPRRVVLAQAPQIRARELPFAMPRFAMDWVTHARSEHDAGLNWLRDQVQAASEIPTRSR